MSPLELALLRVSGRLKHMILALGKRVNFAKKGGPITIRTLYDMFLRKELPFGGCDYCTCVKNFWWR